MKAVSARGHKLHSTIVTAQAFLADSDSRDEMHKDTANGPVVAALVVNMHDIHRACNALKACTVYSGAATSAYAYLCSVHMRTQAHVALIDTQAGMTRSL
jgi:hypothetical protein